MNINGGLYLFQMYVTITNSYLIIVAFSKSTKLFFREYASHLYHLNPYFCGKMAAELPTFIFNNFVFAITFYWMANFNRDIAKFVMFMFTGFLISMASMGFAYMTASMVSNLDTALVITPIMLTPLIIYGGFFITQESMPSWLSWVKYLSWFFYGFEILMTNQWDVNAELKCSDRKSERCFSSGKHVLEFYSLQKMNELRNIMALIALSVGFRTMAFVILALKSRHTYRRGEIMKSKG